MSASKKSMKPSRLPCLSTMFLSVGPSALMFHETSLIGPTGELCLGPPVCLAVHCSGLSARSAVAQGSGTPRWRAVVPNNLAALSTRSTDVITRPSHPASAEAWPKVLARWLCGCLAPPPTACDPGMVPEAKQKPAEQPVQPLPELHWHVDLHQAPRLSAQPAKESHTSHPAKSQLQRAPSGLPEHRAPAAAAVKSALQRAPSGLPDRAVSFNKAARAQEDRPATSIPAQARPSPLQDSPGLQRSASCDIAWRLPQMPKPSASPLGGSHDKGKPAAKPSPETAKSSGAARPSALAPSPGPAPLAHAGSNARALAKAAEPPQPAAAGNDPAALRRCVPLHVLLHRQQAPAAC